MPKREPYSRIHLRGGHLRAPALFREFFSHNDPGLVRLRQAARTVVAVTIQLALFHRFGGLIALFTAFSAAAFMQANSGASRRQRQAVMIVTGAGTAALVFAGALCHGHRVAAELFLMATAFFCFYARRFVPDRNLFTLYSFTLALLASTFAGRWPDPLRLGLAVLSALPVSFVVYFYVWPPVFHVRFAAAVRIFGELAARCIDQAQAELADGGEARALRRRIARLRSAMAACASLITPLKGSAVAKAADALVRLMRRVVVTFELMEENLQSIGTRTPPGLADALAATSAALGRVREEFLSLDGAQNQPLAAEPLREAVVRSFARLPDSRGHEHRAAALLETGMLAVHLEELRNRIASALRDPGFGEDQ